MSLYEIYQPSSLHFNNVNPFCMDYTDEYAFSPPLSTPGISSSMNYLETIFSDEYAEVEVDDFQMDLDDFDHIFNSEQNDIQKFSDEIEESRKCDLSSPSDHGLSEISMDMTSLILPFEGMEVDNQQSLTHLLRAYIEAKDNQETELTEVISHHIIKKVNPCGVTTQRVLYYMFQHLNNESDYLKQESNKNFYPAFKAFYQMFPYGKFPHFVINSSIFKALPKNAQIIHIIDFDIGEGVQWASFMEAIKHQGKEIILTSLKSNEEDETNHLWRFEETKMRLYDHAESCGLKIKVQQVGFQDLESMIKNEDYERESWYVFNCNVQLPHMGSAKSKTNASQFLNLAKDFLHNNGIITYGDGDPLHSTKSCVLSSYTSFLELNLAYYQALLESMELSFPNHLREARIALECLFVAPNVSSLSLDRKWKEKRECGEVEFGVGLEGLEFSDANLVEAKELVKEGVNLFGVRIEGEKKNEMVMEWNGFPMVRVSCWKR